MPDNNENVSLDEMMKSLKRGSESEVKESVDPSKLEEGTLVIRADGSQAVKVRSRKRRSTQPKKEKERKATRNKIILICSGIALMLIFGIAFIFTLAYYNGNKFKEKLVTTVESKTGAEVEMTGVGISVGSAKIMQVNLDWDSAKSVVDYVKIDGLNAGYGVFSFFGGGWKGPEVLADRGEMRLKLLDNPEQISPSGESLVDFDFSTYKCNKLNVLFGENDAWSVKDTQAEFSTNTSGLKQVYLYGGLLKAPFFEEHTIKSGVCEVRPTSADLSFVLQPKKGSGMVALAGDIGYKAGADISLVTKFADVEMTDWVDIKTQRFINGSITKGEGFFKMKLGDFESKEIITHVESNDIAISTFAFIETMSLEMKDSFYIRPSFKDGSTFTMHWKKDRVIFSNINLLENSHMQVRGGFEVLKTGDVNGKLKIGVPIAGLSPVEVRRLKKIFKEDDGDFIWTGITIKGTLGNPTDDLSAQFKLAKGVDLSPRVTPEDEFDKLNEELSE